MSYIEQELYNKILHSIPIICVDGVIKNNNNEILFLKRINEPEKGKWWLPGGRVLKNEKIEQSIIRKIKEETNLDVVVNKMIGITETIFDTGVNNIPTHTINITFLLNLKSYDININEDHSSYLWSEDIDNLDLHLELKKLLENI